MARLKIIFRRVKTLLWTAFSLVVVLAAVVVGIGKLLMPYSDRYQPELESWLSEEFGQPVVLESFEGDWTAFGPRLVLKGMKLLHPDLAHTGDSPGSAAEVVIESAALDIKPINALLPGFPLYNFRLIGADFELLHTADGQLKLSGFGVSNRRGAEGSALNELVRVGEVVLENSNLQYTDERHGIELGFSGINGRLHLEDNELSTEVQARLFDQRSELVYGKIEATLLLILDDEQRMTHAAWQATTRDFMLAAFQGRVPPNPFLPLTGWLSAELWGKWSRQDGLQISGETDLTDAWLINEQQDMELARINSRFRWRYGGKGQWSLHLADFLYDDSEQSWIAPRISIERNTGDDLGLWISADELPLEVPLNVVRDVMSIYGTDWPEFLPRSAGGRVTDLELILNSSWRLRFAAGELHQGSVRDWGRWPDLQGLDGSVSLREGVGRIHLQGEQVAVDWPHMFLEPLSLSIPSCDLDLSWGVSWQVGFNTCRVENDDVGVAADVMISGNQGKPAVDVNAALFRGKIGQLGPYWPESIMKDNIKGWLRRGLRGGEIVAGRFQIHGDMDDWPFLNGEGRFEAFAQVQGGRIHFLDGWPEATGVDAMARFEGASMDISGKVGDIGGVAVESVDAAIGSLRSPLLEIDYRSQSELPGFLGFLRQTPLLDNLQTDLTEFTFSGPASTTGSLAIPLGNVAGELSVDGNVVLDGGLFFDPVSDVTLQDINGSLTYSESGFSGPGLSTVFRDYPAGLSLLADFEADEKFRAELEGIFGVRDVIPEFLLQDFLALEQVGGDCEWQVSLTVAASEDPNRNDTILQVESGLDGIAMDLPAPMNKKPGEEWPLVLSYPLSGPERLLDVIFEDRASLRFDLSGEDSSPLSAVIHLGSDLPALPGPGLIRLEGGSEYIDLDGWIDVIIDEAMSGGGVAGLSLEGGELDAGSVLFLDRNFDDVRLKFDVDGSDINAGFEAEDIDGSLRFTLGDSGTNSLSAEFDRLVLGDPVSTGVDMDSDPSELPALHLYVRSFSYAGVELGETRIEAYPTASGFHFEKVDASSEQISVQASGDWSLNEEGQRSDFKINMASESLGDFLQSLDISSSMEGGQTLVDFNAWWPGSPATFALSRLNGQIVFSVVDGNITNASAGTGRLLGLLSIQALPKRLALDFRDVFDSGFSFDEASGTFEMENGSAWTDNVLLESSAADISISGRTDLVAREYDQLLTIRPGLGNTLPILGALAAGPGGAAVGLALQGLLHDELAEATRVIYSITGDWDDPQFEPVEVDRTGE
jgi:uncharacterized protein (TIGR02099 family)